MGDNPGDYSGQGMTTDARIDASVQNFGNYMRSKLASNRHKGGWDGLSRKYLLSRLKEEVLELEEAVLAGGSHEEICKEAADVGNFAMMLAEVCGGPYEGT